MHAARNRSRAVLRLRRREHDSIEALDSYFAKGNSAKALAYSESRRLHG